jgi:hypothetical protein
MFLADCANLHLRQIAPVYPTKSKTELINESLLQIIHAYSAALLTKHKTNPYKDASLLLVIYRKNGWAVVIDSFVLGQ